MLFSDLFCARMPVFQGYFARFAALRKLLFQFLNSDANLEEHQRTKKQVLSLGAGFDTTYFQLQVFILLIVLLAKLVDPGAKAVNFAHTIYPSSKTRIHVLCIWAV